MHVTDANMHVPAPSMHVTEIAHVNMMAILACMFKTPTWHYDVGKTPTWHFKTPTWHFKTPTWHFKTPNMAFQNSEHGVSLGAGHAPATTLWRARASANGCFD